MPQSIEQLLSGIPALYGLEEADRSLLAGCARNARFSEGEHIFREGEPADSFYLVRHGSVALEAFVPTRGTVVVQTLEPGELLGWSWLFPPHRWHFDARAVSLVRATAFDGACLRQKCEEDPRLGYRLMGRFAQVLIERLQATRFQLLDVYGNGKGR